MGSGGSGSASVGGWGIYGGGALFPIKQRPVDGIEEQMNRKQQLEYERLQNKLSHANKGVSAAMIGNGVKTELIKQAGKLGELAPKVQSYLKGVQAIGYLGAGVTTASSLINAGSYYYNGGDRWQVGFKASMDILMTGVGFIGPIGLGISATYFIVDSATGSFGGFGTVPKN